MQSHPLFWGTCTAMATPMLKDESLDFQSLSKLIDYQVEGNVQSLLFLGTTAETPTLTEHESLSILEKGLAFNAGRLKTIAGVGTNSTARSVYLTKLFQELPIDAIQIVSPYYNKPNQNGLLDYFSRIAESTTKPIMLYCIPGRTNVEIGIDVLNKLCSKYPHIQSIKVSTNNPDRVSLIYRALQDRLTILSGDDGMTLPLMAVGAKGVVSVASNLFPQSVTKMVNLALNNDFLNAHRIHNQYHKIFQDLLSLDVNPIPIKYALFTTGLIQSPFLRSPLLTLETNKIKYLEETLHSLC